MVGYFQWVTDQTYFLSKAEDKLLWGEGTSVSIWVVGEVQREGNLLIVVVLSGLFSSPNPTSHKSCHVLVEQVSSSKASWPRHFWADAHGTELPGAKAVSSVLGWLTESQECFLLFTEVCCVVSAPRSLHLLRRTGEKHSCCGCTTFLYHVFLLNCFRRFRLLCLLESCYCNLKSCYPAS